MNDKKKDHVVFSSAWLGNIVVVAIVVIVLGAALAYKELF
jgi:hypothetical protein